MLEGAMSVLGAKSSARVKASLAEPYPPASKPGESPHLRTGKLQAGVTDTVSRQDDSVTLRITSDRAGTSIVPYVLEMKLDRFYMKPELIRLKAEAGPEIAKALKARLK
jgi:hypothetical protein